MTETPTNQKPATVSVEQLPALLSEAIGHVGPLPLNRDWMYTVIRHGQRNMDVDVAEGFNEPDRQCGGHIADIVNAVPTILATLASVDQGEVEPVAWLWDLTVGGRTSRHITAYKPAGEHGVSNLTPLYCHPATPKEGNPHV